MLVLVLPHTKLDPNPIRSPSFPFVFVFVLFCFFVVWIIQPWWRNQGHSAMAPASRLVPRSAMAVQSRSARWSSRAPTSAPPSLQRRPSSATATSWARLSAARAAGGSNGMSWRTSRLLKTKVKSVRDAAIRMVLRPLIKSEKEKEKRERATMAIRVGDFGG